VTRPGREGGRTPFVLNAVLRAQGSHGGGWRHASSGIDRVVDLDNYVDLARTAEVAGFDTVFLTDVLAASPDPAEALQWPLDPVTLLAAVGARTSRIGLVATHSTTFNAPYNTARQLATLDHLTRGRAGWNVVTSASPLAAPNFGEPELLEHDERYRRAAEYLDVAIALWHAWRDGAVVADRASGRLVDPAGIRRIDHAGPWFSVRGPLNVPRGPQVVPLLAQAGSSVAGRDLAARYADVVYVQQNSLDAALRFRAELRERAVAHGRSPDAVRVLPGIVPFVGRTRAQAHALQLELLELHGVDAVRDRVAQGLGRSLDGYDLDAPFPLALLEGARDDGGSKSLPYRVAEYAGTGERTLRDVLAWADAGAFHRTVVGTPDDVAHAVVSWYEAGALDGVSVIPPVLPAGLDAFAQDVVPRLRDAGVLGDPDRQGTLRERLGLPAPSVDESRFGPHYAPDVVDGRGPGARGAAEPVPAGSGAP